MTRDWTPTDAADAADDARERLWWRTPSELLPTAYRGSHTLTAEAELKALGADLSHGTRNLEGMRDGRMIHRCVDIKSGRWVEVTSGVGYRRHEKVADGFLPPPYPFCRTPKDCAGKGYCPKEIACND